MDTFQINKYLSLKLENGRTKIYVNNSPFLHCRFLLLNIEEENVQDYDFIDSIDEAAVKLDHTMERDKKTKKSIPPKTEFWAHASNLQAWAENNYDTRLLHSNIAFPLLKELTKAGDPKAKRAFKEEIAKRFLSGFGPVQHYLIEEGYIKYLNDQEIETLIDIKKDVLSSDNSAKNYIDLAHLYEYNSNYSKAIETYEKIIRLTPNDLKSLFSLIKLLKKQGRYDKALNFLNKLLTKNPTYHPFWKYLPELAREPYFLSIMFEKLPQNLKKPILDMLVNLNNKDPDEALTYLLKTELGKLSVKFVVFKRKIFKIDNGGLTISREGLRSITEIERLNKIANLTTLSLYINEISRIEGLHHLSSLEELTLNFNRIERIQGLENLHNLKKLELKHNRIFRLEGLDAQKDLEYLNLPNNNIKKIENLNRLTNLKQLVLSFNKIKEIKNLDRLRNLEILDLSYNKISDVNGLEKLNKLKELYLSGNPIKDISGLRSLKNLENLEVNETNVARIPESLLDIACLRKISIANCPIEEIPKSASNLIVSEKETKKIARQAPLEYDSSDINQYKLLKSKPAIWNGKPTIEFKEWLINKKKDTE